MSDFSELIEHVKNILPTVALRIATATTLGTAISIAALPGYLKEVWPELHIPEILLFQLALIFTTLFVGSFVLIVLLLRYIKNLNTLHSCALSEIQNSFTPSNIRENEKTTLTFTSADSVKITPGIQVKATVKQDGWYCVSDDLICYEHQRTLKPDNYSRPYEYTCRAAGCKIKLQTPLANLAIAETKDLAESHIRNTLNVEPKKTNRIYG
jgi:hypothetical protein